MRLTLRPAAWALCVGAGLALSPWAMAASSSDKAKAAKSTPKPSTKTASKSSASTAKAKRPAATPLSEAQRLMADQVYTGRADCEFRQFVVVERTSIDGGSFRVKHRSRTYTMVPEETTTGAVRLVDRKSGVVWIQIPAKSMLLNDRLGQRIIDACAGPAQRQAQAAAIAAAAAAPATVPPSMLGREDSIPAGMMTAPPGAASAPALLLTPPGRS